MNSDLIMNNNVETVTIEVADNKAYADLRREGFNQISYGGVLLARL